MQESAVPAAGPRLCEERQPLVMSSHDHQPHQHQPQQQQQQARESDARSSDKLIEIEEVLYAANAFWATLKPVALTLLLSCLAVVYIQTEESRKSNSGGLAVYDVSDDDAVSEDDDGNDNSSGDSDSAKLSKGLINALVIVGAICGMTFVVVMCYYFKCLKFLWGYMMLSSITLLSLMGGLVWLTALERWDIAMDAITFLFVLFNFAVVGIVAIFFQQGVPMYITQMYLVCTSVILAWHLSRFDEWTGWALLIVLAFYDLCAVLTPCGPLKALVKLMQEYDEPMPGLLYEAELPPPPSHGLSTGSMSSQRMIPLPPPGTPPPIADEAGSHAAVVTEEEALAESRSLEALGAVAPLGLLGAAGFQQSAEYTAMEESEQQAAYGASEWQTSSQAMVEPQVDYSDFNFRDEEHIQKDFSIKLGLGDFVFYSVLVSKAAMYGFATSLACFVVVLGGLGVTLVLLSVYRMALPALPVSIFLGVLFYLCTRLLIMPFMEDYLSEPLYL